MKKLICSVMALAMAASLVACGGSAPASSAAPAASSEAAPAASSEAAPAGVGDPITLKLGHQMNTTVPEGVALQWFADEVNARSGGTITVEVYPNEELGDANTMIDMTKLGTCDLTITSVANFATYNSYFNCGTVPFLYKDNAIAAELNAGDIGQAEMASLRENDLQLVNTARNFYRGPYRVLVSKEPIESVEDIQGLRFRAYENKVYMGAWEALGANPIIIAWGETYSALQQGTVDAATSTIGQLNGVKFTEVAPYVTRINEYSAEAILVCNAKKWDKMSAEQQAIMNDVANEMGDMMDKLSNEAVQADIDAMAANGAVFSDIDTSAFREKLTDFYYGLEKDGTLPAGLVDKALNA